jgi:uncharacterized protein YjbJ (UPF0337 family)
VGVEDMIGKAKEMLGEHSEQVDEAIDKAAEAVEGKTPDNVDGMVEQAAQKAKDAI